MMQFFDSHAHISGDALFEDSAQLIDNAKNLGVLKIVNIATDRVSLERGLLLNDAYPGLVYNTCAITPHDAHTLTDDVFDFITSVAKEKRLVAIGETGLDYHYMPSPKDVQKQVFIRHLHLALENALPVVIHCRDAFQDLFEILRAEYLNHPQAKPGIMHCFTGTLDEAKSSLDRGWYISFSGIVTFKKSETLHDVARFIPLEKALIETDSPYLAPHPLRGKRNEPSFVINTAKFIGELKGISIEDVAKATWDNGHRAFCL